MNRLRFSGSARPDTCSADTVVPRMTNRSTPASTTVFHSCWVRCGVRAPATVTPAARISRSRSVTSSGWIVRAVDLLHAGRRQHRVERGDLGEQRGRGPRSGSTAPRGRAPAGHRAGRARWRSAGTSPSPSGPRSPAGRSGRRRSASRPRPPRGRACGARARWRCRRRNRPGGRACRVRSRSRSPGQPTDAMTASLAAPPRGRLAASGRVARARIDRRGRAGEVILTSHYSPVLGVSAASRKRFQWGG